MKNRKKLIVSIIIITGLFLILYYVFKVEKGELFESYTFEGSNLKIKVEARHQEGFMLIVPGAYYDYGARRNDSDTWIPIFTFLFDDPIDIPKNQIKEINEQVIYAFIGWMYAVTTDGGKNWHSWNGNPKLAQFANTGYGFIDKIQMDPNGLGAMKIRKHRGSVRSVELYSKDFGKTWEETKSK